MFMLQQKHKPYYGPLKYCTVTTELRRHTCLLANSDTKQGHDFH
jgi:hypothetical protein